MDTQDIKLQWRNAGIALSVIFGIILIAFFDTVSTLVMTWWDKPEYNHCLLILPIIAYLVNERREIFQKLAPSPFWFGLIPLLGGGGLWLLGDISDTNVVRQFGLIILIQGCLLTILGKRVVIALLFPFFYMIFLIPFGDFLVPYLQNFTTSFVVTVLNIMNIPVFVEGLYLSIPAGDFHVAEACAGLRFLVATVALGTLMANVAYKTVGRQIIVVVLSFIVPVIANGFRASGIILIAHWSEMKYATGVDHIVFGWIFFAIVLLIFVSIAMTFTNRGLHDGYTDFSKDFLSKNQKLPTKTFIVSSVILLAFALSAPVYVYLIKQRYKTYDHYTLSLDEENWGRNVPEEVNWKPYFAGASQTFHFLKDRIGEAPADIFVAYYKYQSQDSEMIQYGNGVAQSDVWAQIGSRTLSADVTGLDQTVDEVILQTTNLKRVVWYWYWVDGKIVTSKYKAKLLDAKAKLFGGRLDSAVIAVSLLLNNDNIDDKRKQLSDTIKQLPSLELEISKDQP